MANDWDKVRKIIDNVTQEVRTAKTLDATGKYLVNQVRTRTLVGRGVDRTGGPPEKLNIKPKTKQVRRYLKGKGRLSSKTQPAKANLTRSGKMLSTLNARVDRGAATVTVDVAPDQQDKVQKLSRQGHNFLDLTRGEIKGLIEFLFQRIIKNIK